MSFLSNQEGDPESSKGPRRTTRFVAMVMFLAAAVAATAYVLHRSGVDVAQAVSDARTTSEEAATTAAVKTAFALSSKVSAFAIDVATEQGIVRLDGVVPSETIKELAVAIAKDTSGVNGVEDHLTVEPATRPSPEIDRLKGRIADLEIRADLDRALLRNPELDGSEIEISVANRTVTLTGEVATDELRRSIEQIARSTETVRDVVNELVLRDRATAVADETVEPTLTKQVRFELYATGAFNLDLIDVDASDGTVTLAGTVRSQAEKLLAERIVSDVEGVQSVDNELEVLSVPFRASSYDVTKRGLATIIAQSGATW